MRHPIWSTVERNHIPGPLPHEIDVCIIGAGITGLTTAYQLARRGVKAIVLDDGPIGGGETRRTSAHLSSAVDDRFTYIERKFGEDGAKLVAESHAAAIDFIEGTVHELDIDCAFQRVDGFLWGDDLEAEQAAARRAGLRVEMVPRAPLPFDTGPALRFAQQAEFEPMKYLDALAHAIASRGGAIYTNTRVINVEPGEPLVVELADHRRILCRSVVDATNGATTSPIKLQLRQAAYRSYVLAFAIEPGAIPHALYWDTEDPYHYLRMASTEAGTELLVVGGGDHRVGQGNPIDAWATLEAWVRARIPIAGPVAARWSGQIIEPADGVAHIGRSPELAHAFVATGDSGHGLTHGTIAGLMLPDLIRGVHHRWENLYDPNRSHMHSLATLIGEATRSAAPYTDWLKPGDVSSIESIEAGSGSVVRRGLHLVAVYRDPNGACHEKSATCPHLRGVVHWNAGEKSWDCACHGSRFDPYGRVLNGPASMDLADLDDGPRGGAIIRRDDQISNVTPWARGKSDP